MGEKFSDGAIVQHMSKLRQKMVDNNLPVPPPLKRGTTVVPSKIYANSGPARRKSMPETPTYTSTVLETPTPKPKPSTTRKRNRRTGLDSDSDSQPDENEMDIDDTTDDEYGASGRKRKKQQRGAKNKKPAKKQTVQESPKTEIEQTEPAKKEAAIAETDVADEDPIQQSIETPRRASRTRGVRPDYSKLEQGSDEEEEEVDTADVKKEVEADGHDEDMIAENEEDGSKTKSDGEVSPRSKAPETPATPPRLTV